jgi:acyl carrier protein phosphodiesterase
MNYLGHLYLSPAQEDALLGSLMGDFVKGPIGNQYPPAIARAIQLHRRLDSFTDAHPIVALSKSRVSAERRRYAGIMIDMFYDHFLALHWSDFHDDPLETFTAKVYEILERRHGELPQRLQTVAPSMRRWDWFGSYVEVDSILGALNRIAQRLRRDNPLHSAGNELLDHYSELEADFRRFLPDARRFVRALVATWEL